MPACSPTRPRPSSVPSRAPSLVYGRPKVVGKSTPTNPRTTSAIDERDEEPTLGAESAGSAGFVDSALVDAQLLHAGKQCSPLDAQAGSCASWAGYKPVCLFEDAQNLLAVISLPGS